MAFGSLGLWFMHNDNCKKIVRVMNENNENKGTDNDHDKMIVLIEGI